MLFKVIGAPYRVGKKTKTTHVYKCVVLVREVIQLINYSVLRFQTTNISEL